MSIKRHRCLALVLVASMIFSMGGTSYAKQNSQDVLGHWAQSSISKMIEADIVSGYGDGTIRPDQKVTRAEAITMINNLFNLQDLSKEQFKGVPSGAWYEKEMLKARAAGYLGGYGDQTAKPHQNITREEMATLLVKAFDMEEEEDASTGFTDYQQIDTYAKGAINILMAGKYMNGYGDGSLRPKAAITRGELCTLVNNISGTIYHKAGEYSEPIATKNVVINTPGVILKDITIEGDLYITQGVGKGEIKLENMTVKGNIYITSPIHLSLEGNLGNVVGMVKVGSTGNGAVIKTSMPLTIHNKAESISVNDQKIALGTIKVDAQGKAIAETTKASGGSSGGGSGGQIPPTKDEILKVFTFDTNLEGWENGGSWEATFGTPDLSWSDALGNGALKANVVFKGDQGWSEIKLKNPSVPQIANATQVTYDLFFDLSVPGIENDLDKSVAPHLYMSKGDSKIGQGLSTTQLGDFKKVALHGKEYGKLSVEVALTADETLGETELWIMTVCNSLSYTGPMYIDNIKLTRVSTEGKDWGLPGVLPNNNQSKIDTTHFATSNLQIVDDKATKETASLFAYLKNVAQTNLLFGHQNATSQGVTFTKTDGKHSDIYNAVGAYPAVFGWDTLAMTGDEGTFDELVVWIQEAAKQNGMITISAHMPNFVTGGNYNDLSGNPVQEILKEGSHGQKAFLAYLDEFARLAKTAKDEEGQFIPIMFRPFHENTGGWFWWGATSCTAEEYIKLYRYTVEYLRDEKGVHNLLYIYSPNGHFTDQEEYLTRYPGDNYVDIIAFDAYHDKPQYNDGWMEKLIRDCQVIVELAEERGKIATISEVGVRWDGQNGIAPKNNTIINWYTQVLDKIMKDEKASQIAYMLVWRNGTPSHFWVPYRNHPTLGHHEMLDDFITYYNNDYTVFSDRLQKVYDLETSQSEKEIFAYIVSPSSKKNLVGDTEVKVKVQDYGKTITRVEIKTDNQEISLTLDGKGYYTGILDLSKELEKSKIDLSLWVNGTLKDRINVRVKYEEIEIDPSVVDNFESYEGDQDELRNSYTANTGGGSNKLFLVEESGNSKLKLHYEIGSYTGITKTLPGVNWTQYGQVEFELTPDGKGQKMVIQIAASGTQYEAYYNLDGAEKITVTIPFKDFVRPAWAPDKGVSMPQEKLRKVTEFSIYINAQDGTTPNISSDLYFDNIKASGQGTQVPGGEEVVLHKITFDPDIEGAEVDTPYAGDGGTAEIVDDRAYYVSNDDIQAAAMDIKMSVVSVGNWVYQKVAMKIPDLKGRGIDLAEVGKIKATIYFKVNGATAAILTPELGFSLPSGEYKTIASGELKLTDLDTANIDGEAFYVYPLEVNLSGVETATDLTVAFIGKDMNYEGPLYVDHIQFISKGETVDYKDLKVLKKESDLQQINCEGIWGVDGTKITTGSLYYISFNDVDAVGMDIKIEDDGDRSNWSHQEIKFKLVEVDQLVDLNQVKKVSFDLIIEKAGLTSMTSISPDISFTGDIKLGEQHNQSLGAIEEVTIGGEVYYVLTSIFDAKSGIKEAQDMMIHFTGKDLVYEGSIYITNIKFIG